MFLGSGSFDHNSTKLRFLVMERYGKDVEELFLSSGRRFDVSTVLMLGLRVVSINVGPVFDSTKTIALTRRILLVFIWRFVKSRSTHCK